MVEESPLPLLTEVVEDGDIASPDTDQLPRELINRLTMQTTTRMNLHQQMEPLVKQASAAAIEQTIAAMRQILETELELELMKRLQALLKDPPAKGPADPPVPG